MRYLAHSAKGAIPDQSYKEHISEVLRMAMDSAARIAPHTKYASLLQAAIRLSATFHDLGKLDDENQKVLKGGRGKLPINHVDGGVAHLLSESSVLRNLSALCVYSHHREMPSLPEEAAKGTGRIFRDEALIYVTKDKLSEYLNRHESSIGLSEVPEDYDGPNPTSMLMRIALSCLVDADHTDTARHYNNVVVEGEIPLKPEERLDLLDWYVERLGREASDNPRTALRKQVYAVCRHAKPADAGIIACDSPVGTGKTTAVMAHLLNVARQKSLRQIFVVLPFTNIIDQTVDVYRKALVMKNEIVEKVVAAHHHRAEFEDLEIRAFSFLWNAPVTVTTAVQFFETLASNYPAALRKLHQLPGSAIFLDEAHAALPAHLWPQAWKWLQELVKDWGCYVVMASGSLTRFWELKEFSSPPVTLNELVQEDVRRQTQEAEKVRIKYEEKKEVAGLDDLCEWVQSLSGPRLVILNTVHSAAALAEQLAGRDRIFRHKVEHLSNALSPTDREQTIKRVKDRLADKDCTDWTLVATSCVEAGMDFSFRTAAREFCSLVSTVQTAGRINRSGEFQESDLWNFKSIFGNGLREHAKCRSSATILEDLFKEGKVSPEYCKEAMRREVRGNNQGKCDDDPIVKAEKNWDFPEVEDKFKVIDCKTVTVIVDEELKKRFEQGDRGITPSEIQQQSVNIYSTKINDYALKPLDNSSLYAWTLAYDDFIGYMAGVLEVDRHVTEGSII
jgi:CRISPR-associated endonuclease/helicase Cas3